MIFKKRTHLIYIVCTLMEHTKSLIIKGLSLTHSRMYIFFTIYSNNVGFVLFKPLGLEKGIHHSHGSLSVEVFFSGGNF